MNKIIGISQSDMSHYQPINRRDYAIQKSIIRSELMEDCINGVIRQKISGSLLNNAKKIKLKYFNRYRNVGMKDIKQRAHSYITIKQLSRDSIESCVSRKEQESAILKHCSTEDKIIREKKFEDVDILRKKSQETYEKQKGYFHKIYKNQRFKTEHSHKRNLKALKLPEKVLPMRKQSIAQSIQILSPKRLSNISSHKKLKFNSQKKDSISRILQLQPLRRQKTNLSSLNGSSVLRSFINKRISKTINSQIWKVLSSKQLKLSQSNEIDIQNKSNNQSSWPQLLVYIDCLPNLLKILIKKFLQFFQFTLPAIFNQRQYAVSLQEARKTNSRGWSALGFMFWDKNADGIIDISDIFAYFTETDEAKSKKKMSEQQANKTKNIQIIKKISIIDTANKLLIEMISQFNTQLKYSKKDTEQFSSQYLEQAILTTDKHPSLTKILPLIHASPTNKINQSIIKLNSQNTSQIRVHSLQLFPKGLSKIKKATAYQQCHIANQHNQETRFMKDQVENARMKLGFMRQKNKKKQQQQLLMIEANGKMCYSEFVEKKIGGRIKSIVLAVLGDSTINL